MTRNPADFGGQCLIGECAFEAELLVPSTTYFGLAKSARTSTRLCAINTEICDGCCAPATPINPC